MEKFTYADTSSKNYRVGLLLTIDRASSSYETCVIRVQPQLSYVGSNKINTVARHNWEVKLLLDGGNIRNRTLLLPDNTAENNVETEGRLDMLKGEWYNWGESFSVELYNRGDMHTIEIQMGCLNGEPYHCPAQDKHLTITYTTQVYTGYLYIPQNLEAFFNRSTRELNYQWTPTSDERIKYFLITRDWYDSTGKLVSTSEALRVPNSNGTYKVELTEQDLPIKEILPTNVAYVRWWLSVYGELGGHITSEMQSVECGTNADSVWINVNGQWKKAVPLVDTGAGWKKINKIYVKVSDTFKRITT